jgi:hypothetical protein
MLVAPFIKEETTAYTRHDQLFKQLIHTFFKEFLEAFFPEVHELVDFHSVKPLSEEVYTDLIEGNTRRLDIVVETKIKGTDTMIIVHIEPQSSQQTHFNERMYHYYSMLFHKYRKPIIPIAVFSYEENWEKNQYTITFPFLHVLTFNYLTLHLRKQNWREYIQSNNPAAAALLSTMGYSGKERVQVKKEFLQMLFKIQLNPAKQKLIFGFFDTYLRLTNKEEKQLAEEFQHVKDGDKIMEIPISYEQKGIEKGKRLVALEMLREGDPVERIKKLTKLNIEEIEELKKKL